VTAVPQAGHALAGRAARRAWDDQGKPIQHRLGPELVKRRPDITMDTVDKFLNKMYRTNPNVVWTVTSGFVRNCQTPVLILPDDIPAHPYAVAMEAAMLAPKAEVSMFPW